MNNFFSKIKGALAAHKFITAVVIIILAVGGYYGYQKFSVKPVVYKYVTEAAAKTTISVSVTGSGQVSELNSIDLKPLTSGVLTAMNIKKGDQVKTGQVIATIDQRSALAGIAQARASLANAQASYDTLKAGATAEDIRISQNSVSQAENSYNNALLSQQNTTNSTAANISQLQSALDDLVNYTSSANPTNKRSATFSTLDDKLTSDRSALDAENKVFQDQNLKNTLSVLNSSLLSGATSNYQQALSLFNVANISLDNAKAYRSDANVNQAVSDEVGAMNMTLDSLNSIYNALQNSVPGANSSQTQIDSYKTSINSQLSTVNSGISAIQVAAQALKDAVVAAQNALDSAKISTESQLASAKAQVQSTYNSWQTAKDQYAKLIAPATIQQINSALASLSSAKSQYQQAVDTFNNTTITAPFDGQIAVSTLQKGDQVSGSSLIATLITNQYVAIIPLNEVDVAKIKLGDSAIMTFDAIDGLSITGKVIDIDTLGTVSQGVVTYNVKISLDTSDPQVKPGMSTSVSIITETKTDVIAVPNAAIKVQGGTNYVQTLDANGKPQNVIVQIGIADDSYTEIISGVNEGDNVVTQTINLSTAAKTTTTANSSIGSLLGGSAGRGGAAGGAAFRATGAAGGGAARPGN